MNLSTHLIATDASVFRLIEDHLISDLVVTAVIIPSNRLGYYKIEVLQSEAAKRGIPVFTHVLGGKINGRIPPADFAVSWMYSQIIKADDLKLYSKGTLNMHGGKIPEYRGASVLQWAIINGEKELGVTWHSMVGAVDAGEIYAEGRIPILPDSDAWDIRQLMIEEGVRLFPEALTNILSNRVVRVPVLSNGRVWHARKPADGYIFPGLTERELKDLVRALCPPWPRAFIYSDEGAVSIESVSENWCEGAVPYMTADRKFLYLLKGSG